jgi:hypothetical protein
MNKYNIVSIFFRFDCGHVSIILWFSSMIFHKAQMYATHIVVIMEAGVECMCSNICQVLCWKDNRRIGVVLRFMGGSGSRSRRRSLKGFFLKFWGKGFVALKKEFRKQEAQNVKCMRRGGWDWSFLETRFL